MSGLAPGYENTLQRWAVSNPSLPRIGTYVRWLWLGKPVAQSAQLGAPVKQDRKTAVHSLEQTVVQSVDYLPLIVSLENGGTCLLWEPPVIVRNRTSG